MSSLAFFDTNLFLYMDDFTAPHKQAVAIELVTLYQRQGAALLSLQVLQEYFAISTRKYGVSAELAQRKVENLARMRVVRFDETDVVAAIELHRLHSIAFWDAMIIHAARIGGAAVLYSEDLQHGRIWPGKAGGSVTVVNPFIDGL
jgi:predicted nucleic acid-binding protein